MRKKYPILSTNVSFVCWLTRITFVCLLSFSSVSFSAAIEASVPPEDSEYADDDDESEYLDITETVVMTTDLLADAKLAQQKQVPILLLFTQQSCSFCEMVRSEFLRPMLLNRDYDSRVLIRQIEYDGADVVNFDGKNSTMDEFMEPYNVDFTPTVIFIDSSGTQLTEQVVGITTVDYYGGFIDDNIELALKKIRSRTNAVAIK